MQSLVIFILLVFFSTSTYAQQRPQESFNLNSWNVIVATGTFVSPQFEGSKQYRVLPLPFIRASKGNYFIQTEGPGLTANILNHSRLKLGPSLQFRSERDKDVKNSVLKKFKTINSSIEAGGFLSYSIPVGPPGTNITTKIKAMFDLGDAHNGYTINSSITFSKVLNRRTRIGITLSTNFGDQNYNNTYYGLSAYNKIISGYSLYKAGSGFNDIGSSVNVTYSLKNNWGLIGIFGYKKLIGPAKNSPIIKNIGTRNQFLSSIGVSYRF